MNKRRAANLNRLLNPKQIAVYGGKDAEVVINECRRIGYNGQIWPVNPKRKKIAGINCFSSTEKLPYAPDASFIAVPREPAIDIIKTLRINGGGGAVCYTAGFSEIGGDGIELEKKLIKASGDIALIGPNCYGAINFLNKVALWPFAHGGKCPGYGAAIVTQSGMLSSDLLMSQRSMPFAYMISAGNQSVLRLEDFIEYFSKQEEVRVIGLHIESIKDIYKFQTASKKALENNIPIVALKTGTSKIGNLLVNSHTGSLSGTDELYNALFKQLGIIRVSSVPEFLETLKFITISGIVKGKSVAGFTCSGGGATMLADYAETINLDFIQPSKKIKEKLKSYLPKTATVSNPLDYTTPIWGLPEKTKPVFDTFLKDKYNVALLVQDYPKPGLDEGKIFYLNDAKELIKASNKVKIPLAICSTLPENIDEETREFFISKKISPMQGLQEALNSIHKSYQFYLKREEMKAKPLDFIKVPKRKNKCLYMLDESSSKKHLKDVKINIPKSLSGNPKYILENLNEISSPFALKMLSSKMEHKTETGALSLNIKNEKDLKQEIFRIQSEIQKNETIDFTNNFLVEEMQATPIAEILIGIHFDQDFGYILTLASGGIFTNLIMDSSTRLLPLSQKEIDKTLSSLKINQLLTGYRGKRFVDRKMLIQNIIKLIEFSINPNNKVHLLEINPLFVYEDKVTAVDAVIWKF